MTLFTARVVSKYGVFFWSVFSRIWAEYAKIRTRKNSIFGQFSHSDYDMRFSLQVYKWNQKSFSFIEENDILKEIKNLQINKDTQGSDISTKLIKNNSNLFVDFIFTNLNYSIVQPTIPSKTGNYNHRI